MRMRSCPVTYALLATLATYTHVDAAATPQVASLEVKEDPFFLPFIAIGAKVAAAAAKAAAVKTAVATAKAAPWAVKKAAATAAKAGAKAAAKAKVAAKTSAAKTLSKAGVTSIKRTSVKVGKFIGCEAICLEKKGVREELASLEDRFGDSEDYANVKDLKTIKNAAYCTKCCAAAVKTNKFKQCLKSKRKSKRGRGGVDDDDEPCPEGEDFCGYTDADFADGPEDTDDVWYAEYVSEYGDPIACAEVSRPHEQVTHRQARRCGPASSVQRRDADSRDVTCESCCSSHGWCGWQAEYCDSRSKADYSYEMGAC